MTSLTSSAALFLAFMTPVGVFNCNKRWRKEVIPVRDNVIQVRCHPHSGVSKHRCLRFGFTTGNGTLGPQQSCSNEGFTQASVAAWTVSVDQRRWVSGTISRHAMVQIPQKSRGHYYLGRYSSIICNTWQIRCSLSREYLFRRRVKRKIPSIEENMSAIF